ncbi:AAA family ATPase [Nocardia sp. NPDC057353]|uniref:helix-turn-helix transcriptional regulator n=1 Tax=Nocardia sp. NPDC057353 TaxID=3346104 RepID=UPI003633F9B2
MPTALFGRAAELARIDAMLAAARTGRSGALVLRGEAGIGKTALLEHAAAAGLPTVRGAGIESEAELPFAALHLLVRGADLGALPPRQRAALDGAFGLAEHDPADRMLIGLAVLSLLAEEAADGPLLCLVDDAHWLDRATAETLLFAARRLDAEGVALIFATRAGEHDFPAPGLPELPVGALPPEAAATLLDAGHTGLSPTVRYRALVESAGNPLALLELPALLAAETEGAAPEQPLPQRLRRAFQGQVARLPAATRTLLLVAAAADTAELGTVLRAAAALGAGPAELAPAERAGLVRTGTAGVVFRHPLLRSAVYRSAPLPERLAAHRALADAATGPENADIRAWHLAAAATGPDEAVAAALEETAERARRRSGYHGAVAAYERAAALSVDDAARARRLVPAAETAAEAGLLDLARRSAERAAAVATPEQATLARLDVVRGLAEFGAGRPAAAHRLLLGAAAASEPARAARILIQAVHPAWYLGDAELTAVADAFAGLALPEVDPVAPIAGYMLPALRGTRTTDLRDAAAAARRHGAESPRDLVQLCGAGLVVGQDAQVAELAAELIAECREQGRIALLPPLLFFLAEAELFGGNRAEAAVAAAEGLRIAVDAGLGQWVSQHHAFRAYLAALAGDERECAAAVAAATAVGGVRAPGGTWAEAAQGLLELGLGRVAGALHRLTALTAGPVRHHVAAARALPDVVEAAVRLGEPERAGDAVERLAEWARRGGQPWVAALEQRCRALLTGDERYFRAALESGARPLEQARTRLLYGEWLRRAKRKTEARAQLEPAAETFERAGAAPWAARARTELAAIGGGASTPAAPGPLARLTPQELQIVRLAARGLSNRDIAAQLFLSPRTVGHHLYKAYPKLGVAARGELAGLPLEPG